MPTIPINIIGLAVETERGISVGKVIDVAVDKETHQVTTYFVASKPFLKKILNQKSSLCIAPAQVISLTFQKMIVSDLNTKEPIDAFEELVVDKKIAIKPKKAVEADFSVKNEES